MFVCISFCTWGWSKIIAPPKTSIWSGPQSLSPQSPANVISTCLRWSSSTSLHLYLNWYRTLDCVFVHLWSHGGHNQQLMWSNAIKSGVQQRLTAMKCNLGNWNPIVYNIRALATWWAGGGGVATWAHIGFCLLSRVHWMQNRRQHHPTLLLHHHQPTSLPSTSILIPLPTVPPTRPVFLSDLTTRTRRPFSVLLLCRSTGCLRITVKSKTHRIGPLFR